ncbi:hypothetical protein C3H36_03595 [Campylobacter jejuni]|uniref:hypothetical protein n=1 Tax=Campylobacter jejuni TaxID=197 RepID=UPI000F80A4C4|nr:hypothetical protein [Campylobacter jejuni]RTK00220.1 hypothetical protein C3H36_03595 [Campylobacter jejuni]
MYKKIMFGGIALAATGYGIKKLYDVCCNETKSKNVYFEEDALNENDNLEKTYSQINAEHFNAIQKNLFKISHFEKEILSYEFKALDFEFDDENFQLRMRDFNEFLEKYQEGLNSIVSQKESFEELNEEEKRLFVRFNELNTLMVILFEAIKTNHFYPDFADEKLKNYIDNDLWKDL